MNWACIIFDAMSIFLNIKQLISKAVHKEVLSHILSFTHEANSFCIILLRIAFHMLVLSIQFPMPLLVPSDGLGVAWGWSGAALGWPGAILLSGNYPGIKELTQRWHPNRGVGTCEKCNVFKATKLTRTIDKTCWRRGPRRRLTRIL